MKKQLTYKEKAEREAIVTEMIVSLVGTLFLMVVYIVLRLS